MGKFVALGGWEVGALMLGLLVEDRVKERRLADTYRCADVLRVGVSQRGLWGVVDGCMLVRESREDRRGATERER
jgi:hypothetical protein